MITVIGIFDDINLAEQASSYLLANDFNSENVDIYTSGNEDTTEHNRVDDFFNHLFENEKEANHYASLGRRGTVVTVHTISTREAQEAVDALNNHGAIDVNAANEIPGSSGIRSQIVERFVDESKRLK